MLPRFTPPGRASDLAHPAALVLSSPMPWHPDGQFPKERLQRSDSDSKYSNNAALVPRWCRWVCLAPGPSGRTLRV